MTLRSPVPLLAAGVALALVVILLVAGPRREAGPDDPSRRETLNEREAITLVAREMRTSVAAIRVVKEGKARFDDGSWFISVGDAAFRFSERNRIVLAENDPALTLQFQDR